MNPIQSNELPRNNNEDEGNQTGNMYSYHDESHIDPPKESNAIRRSIGDGTNPNLNPYLNNDNIDNGQIQNIVQYQESNAVRRSIEEGKNQNIQNYPNYIDNRSSEQRFPNSQNNQAPFQMYPPVQENIPPIYRPNPREPKKFYSLIFILVGFYHIIMIILIGCFYEFQVNKNEQDEKKSEIDEKEEDNIYHFFKDVHIMLFIGFGMLYTMLKDHQWSSIALVLFMNIISMEFSFFCYYLWSKAFRINDNNEWMSQIPLNFNTLTEIDFNSATVIITLGAIIGKLTIAQYFLICIFETFFSSLNYFICFYEIVAIDNGGSLYIHTFGGIFGVVVSIILFCRETEYSKISNNPHLNSDYYSNLFSFIGSIFLWLLFPSFNVANIQINNKNNGENPINIKEILRYRGIVNTYLSMMGSLISCFVFSPMFHKGKIKIEHLLNASYVGGIIIGGCCTICSSAWGAILIGFIGGSISVLCLWKLKSIFKNNKLEDTFGVLHTFAIPGILGGFLTCIFIGNFQNKLAWGEIKIQEILGDNFNKDLPSQAGLQVAAICVTMAIAGLSGVITGFIVNVMDCQKNEIYFVDSELFIEDENVPLPEWKYPRQNDSNLSSSGNKLDEQEREVHVEQEV